MAMAAEAFGNKMCFLEDITLEVNIEKSFLLILINTKPFFGLKCKSIPFLKN
jgi:hypothetical protein